METNERSDIDRRIAEAEEAVRAARAPFGPGDEFCALWHLFALLPGGAGSWAPRFAYS